MNDQQILELLAKTPDIRAVQVADRFDKDLVDASDALRSLVDIGDVVRRAGTAPNGQPTQMYNLSQEYRRSREGVALLARVAGRPTDAPTPAPATAAPPVSEPAPQQPAIDIPRLAPSPASRVDRAIAFVAANETVSDDDLRTAMGLVRPNAPAAYLKSAMAAGKLHKLAGYWRAGRAAAGETAPPAASHAPAPTARPVLEPAPTAPAAPAEPCVASVEPASHAAEVVPATPKPSMAVQAPDCAPVTDQTPARSPVYRCALWSDDVLEIRRNGVTVAEFPKAAGESLAAFLGRLVARCDAGVMTQSSPTSLDSRGGRRAS